MYRNHSGLDDNAFAGVLPSELRRLSLLTICELNHNCFTVCLFVFC
jgi:hypothetical protein